MLADTVSFQKDLEAVSTLGSGLLTQADLDLLLGIDPNELVTSFTSDYVEVSDLVTWVVVPLIGFLILLTLIMLMLQNMQCGLVLAYLYAYLNSNQAKKDLEIIRLWEKLVTEEKAIKELKKKIVDN